MLLDAAIALQQLRLHLRGLLFDVGAQLLQLSGVLLELRVVDLLELVVLDLRLGRADTDLLLLAILRLGILAQLLKLLLVAAQRIHQLLHGLGALVGVLGGRRRIGLDFRRGGSQQLVQTIRLVANGLQAILHDGDFALQLLHVGLLIHQEGALLQELLPVFRLTHLVLKAIGLHVHLHKLPQLIQMH